MMVPCACACREVRNWALTEARPNCGHCNGSGVRHHPKMRYTRWHAICPKCNYNGGRWADGLDGFDVIGADHGCVFCPECHEEIAT